MPILSSALETDLYLRVLLLGPPKIAKTTVAVCTSPDPVRVLLCEGDTALRPALQRGGKFDFERCKSEKAYEQMTTFLVQAKEDAKEGRIKTLVIDPLSDFADRLLAQSMQLNKTQNGEEDGRRAFPHYTKRLLHCLDLAFTVPCHLIVISHFLETGGGDLGGLAKTGEGIVPLLPGSARARVSARFNDVIWMDIDKADRTKRSFYTGPQGAWGPGCRSLMSFSVLPADFKVLIEAFAENQKPKKAEKIIVNGVTPTLPRHPALGVRMTKPLERAVAKTQQMSRK